MKISVIGASTTKFGELWEDSPESLANTAFENALADSGLDKKHIDALFVGNALTGIMAGQQHLGAFFAQSFGVSGIPAFHIEAAGASGGLAVNTAVNAILSGRYGTVAVLGVEKMTDHRPAALARALMGGGSDNERNSGVTLAGLYAMMTRAYTSKYGLSEKDRAEVPVKNHFHASLNPKAQFRNLLTPDKVMNSPLVADPLRLLECAPVSDGAAAIIISSVHPGKVQIAASEVATDYLDMEKRESLTESKATQRAAAKAYDASGFAPEDIDLAEVHDSFSVAEIIALEDLGFFAKGQAGRAIASGQATFGSAIGPVINSSGGLKAGGAPIGATGVAQIVKIYDQLKGRAGTRQVNNARIGLTHNVGGSGGTAVIHILKNND